MPDIADPNETLKQLQSRHQEFNNRKIQVQTQRDETNKALEKLRKQAEKEFGSSDIDALKKKLAKMTADNEKKVAQYDKQLNAIEKKLNAVTDKFDVEEDGDQEYDEYEEFEEYEE